LLCTKVDLSKGRIFKIKVWSPKRNIKVRMRLEQQLGITQPLAYEVFKTLATATECVTLTFDFSAQTQSTYTYTRLILNTNWDGGGSGEKYYSNDISQE
jgi:hypothetical protein